MRARWNSCAAGASPTRCASVGTPEDFPHTALYCTTLTGFEIARIERPHHGGSGPTADQPGAGAALQPDLARSDPARACAELLDCVDLRYRCRFESCREAARPCHRDRARSRARRAHRASLRAIVIDCSGGHSPIRRALGIGMSGSPYLGYFLSIFVRAPELWTHHSMGKAALINFVEPKGLWRNLVSLDGRELYRFGVRGKAVLRRARQGRRRAAVQRGRRQGGAARVHLDQALDRAQRGGGPLPHRPHLPRRRRRAPQSSGRRARPQHRARRRGRSRLEARRGASPAGAARALLDSYEIERRPVGLRNVGHADVSHAGDREREPPTGHRRRHAGGRRAPARRWATPSCRAQTRKVITDGLALGYRYDPSPIVWHDGTPAPEDTVTDYHPTARARQPRAARLDRRRSLDHRPVRQGLCADAAWRQRRPDVSAIERAFAQRGVPLTIETDRRSRRSARSTNARSCWCGPTATSPGAPTRRRPIRWRWPTACAEQVQAPAAVARTSRWRMLLTFATPLTFAIPRLSA